MSASVRIALSAGILLLAWWVSGHVRHLAAFAHSDPARLGFEMMGIGVGLAIFAIGCAVALPGRVARRLGLGPSRLRASAGIALVIGTLGLSLAVDTVMVMMFTRAVEGSVATGISRGVHAARGHDFAIALLGTAIAPAVGEELLCRGLLQRALARALGPVAAIAAAAIFFGCLHRELVHGTMAAILGGYMGIAAYWSDSTRPAIAAHAANNVVAMLGSAGIASLALPAIPGICVGLALAALGLLWAWRARPQGEATGALLQPGGHPADP
jgi:membrane protease YdiL (CAAX protease family)